MGPRASITCDPPSGPCVPRDATGPEAAAISAAIESINESLEFCAVIKQNARYHVFRIYDTDDGNWGDHHGPSASYFPEESHLWSGNFNHGEAKNTIIHEIAHHLGYTSERDANWFMEACQ